MKKILLSFLMLLTLTSCVSTSTRLPDFKNKAPGDMRIASYNLHWRNNSCTETCFLIRKVDADIMLLQETNPQWTGCIYNHFHQRYAHIKYFNHGCLGGMMVLSKYPIKADSVIEPSMGWHPAWWLDMHTPFGDIEMINVHLNPQLVNKHSIGDFGRAVWQTPLYRRLEIEFLYTLLDPRDPAIIAGDFNEWDFGAAATFLRKRGFHDALLETRTPYHTFHFGIGRVGYAQRFDRLYYSFPLHAKRVQVLNEGASDHYPVVVDFKKHDLKQYCAHMKNHLGLTKRGDRRAPAP